MTYRANPKITLTPFIKKITPWKERQDQIEKLRDEYVQRFASISTIMTEAKSEGWDLDAWRYVYAVADIQAQMIAGGSVVGFDSVSIFGAGKALKDTDVRAFLFEQKRQAETGQIDVAIPTGRVNDWKETQLWRRVNKDAKKA